MVNQNRTNVAVIVSIIVGTLMVVTRAQIFTAPLPYQNLANPAVVLNSQLESQLPTDVRRSDRFYSNPSVAAGLAKESWLTDKEMPVFEREADKIDRSEIYKIVKHAGFIRRR